MNIQEHLLVKLAEECAEVIHAVSKALNFGLNDGYPGTDRTNVLDIYIEILDVVAIIDMLNNYNTGLPVLNVTQLADHEHIFTKYAKVTEYIKYAKDKGIIKE